MSYGSQGGSQWNTGGGQGGGNDSGSYGGGGNDDWQGAVQHARQHGGDSGDEGMFSNVISHLQGNSDRIQQDSNIDEGQFVQAHQNMYGDGGGNQQHSAQTMGMGAAMQALKMFSGGGSGGEGAGMGGGPGQNQFVGMAMGQASKLFDQQNSQGNVEDGADKESVVKQAGEMALKMYMKSQMGGGGSGLMSMASKFM